MKKPLLIFIVLLTCLSCENHNNSASASRENDNSRPKLVVGIVVDQMRYDYLTRFYNKYGNGGFKRMINEGFNLKNNHYNYIPTATGPGHASIYTGTTPKYHGVIGNSWYDKEIKANVYCAGDDSVNSVGSQSRAGQMSPHRMKTTTFADENRLFTQMKGKSIGIAIKDRGAILAAGHTANAAYWFHGRDEGKWISSTFYMKELPKWVNDFNNSKTTESYLKPWNTLLDIETYIESGSDLNNFEGGFKGKKEATFPYDLAALKDDNDGFDILKTTPYGNSLTTDFTLAAIEGEQLGLDNITDVLTISYSSTDYVGHNFGVNSKEVEDAYIRLDKDLERLFNFLDAKIGKGEYTVFLTADHGAVNVPSYLQSIKIPSGYVDSRAMSEKLSAFMQKAYGTSDLIENFSAGYNQIFLNRAKVSELKLNLEDVQEAIVNEIINYENVDKAYTATTMINTSFISGIELVLQNGFNQKRSGDVLYVNNSAYISSGRATGSSHGTGFNYDTHVPLLFFGKGIKTGETMEKTRIIDIAPTMSALLGISFPNANTGKPIMRVLDKLK
ncbi:alkaline phosphatase family protein [Flavobacteriaceae bacterium AU392]|nr:alkaline phosphatase family protein [Flavobacteriaceae bacterium]RKM82667.1 alkaline phosphatase family protein [Flavobacteriaceae bacterium AU392]